MSILKDLNINYTKGDANNFSGRKTALKNQYWHQDIKVSHIDDIQSNNKTNIGIIGYICDEGVRRNKGRIGAKNGPKSVRNKLGKLPIHFKNKNITDFGDIICVDENLEDCQKGLSAIVQKLITNNSFPIAIGGGHDIAYANFNGIKKALKGKQKNKIGIINFDAHFDLRPVENQPNSGTPFNQILSENDNVQYLVIGIQQQSNTKELFQIAHDKNVNIINSFECDSFNSDIEDKLNSFINKVDHLYVTIDLDGFSSAYATGVSAPSPLGFSPNFVFNTLTHIFKSKKVISCDIAELNPTFDVDTNTANLAARILDFIVVNL